MYCVFCAFPIFVNSCSGELLAFEPRGRRRIGSKMVIFNKPYTVEGLLCSWSARKFPFYTHMTNMLLFSAIATLSTKGFGFDFRSVNFHANNAARTCPRLPGRDISTFNNEPKMNGWKTQHAVSACAARGPTDSDLVCVPWMHQTQLSCCAEEAGRWFSTNRGWRLTRSKKKKEKTDKGQKENHLNGFNARRSAHSL